MNVTEYIQQRFQPFGITISEADLLDIQLSTGLSADEEVTKENHDALNVGITRYIPLLLLRATSVSENGFSMSWDIKGLKDYYSYMCRKYGLKDEINTDKPRVKFL
ncbi:MAG: hypothetical protein J6A59_05770 [Lachnospiraceae bacterium]|nr:hypothetical protein [Lachnospiraceae bacterium]MBO5407464.1 hypothetical protein [Bacteroidales bacterium]